MLEILSPYDLSTIEKLPMQDADDVEKALDTTPYWNRKGKGRKPGTRCPLDAVC